MILCSKEWLWNIGENMIKGKLGVCIIWMRDEIWTSISPCMHIVTIDVIDKDKDYEKDGTRDDGVCKISSYNAFVKELMDFWGIEKIGSYQTATHNRFRWGTQQHVK